MQGRTFAKTVDFHQTVLRLAYVGARLERAVGE